MAKPKHPHKAAMRSTGRQRKPKQLSTGEPTEELAMARKGVSKGMRKAVRQQNKLTNIGGHAFEKVADNALFSPDGMGAEELEKFARGTDPNLVFEALNRHLPKKETHLIDRILDGQLFNPDAAPPLGVLHHAKKFIFDSSASEFIGSLLKKAQIDVLSQHDWARPPFDVTWVEFDHAAYWERGLKLNNDLLKGAPDNLLGFLVDHGTVSLFSYAPGGFGGIKQKPCGCGPFMYQLHVPISFEEELEMARRHGVTIHEYRQALLGGMVDELGTPLIPIDWWNSMAGEIVRSHKMFVNPVIKGDMDSRGLPARAQALAAGAGDLKLIITLLLMVTRPRRMFAVSDVGPKRMLYKGHNLVRRAHSVVTMRLSKEKAMHRAITHEFTSQH